MKKVFWTPDRRAVAIEYILDNLAEGRSLNAILKDKDRGEMLPAYSLFLGWLAEDEDLQIKYARARQAQADVFADEIIEIADEQKAATDANHVNAARLRIDARKWHAGKTAPKKYGDRILNEHSGPEGGPIKHDIGASEEVRSLVAALAAEKAGSGQAMPEPAKPAAPEADSASG